MKCWTFLDFIPRVGEWINLQDILMENEIAEIKRSSLNWSGAKGVVKIVEYRHDENDFYVEISVWCED